MVTIDKLMIEVTRKCNLKCEHCLRGEAQNISMCKEYLESFLSNVRRIRSLGFTGGEPTLPEGIKVINDFADIVSKNKIEIYDFWVITNGKEWRQEINKAFNRMYDLVDGKCLVEFSRDQFHYNAKSGRDIFSWNIEQNKTIVDGIKSRKFDIVQRVDYLEPKQILSSGRARQNGIGSYRWKPGYMRFLEKNNTIWGDTVYVNCKGNVIWGCDHDYLSQDRPKNIICSVNENLEEKAKIFSSERSRPR